MILFWKCIEGVTHLPVLFVWPIELLGFSASNVNAGRSHNM